MKTQSRTRYVLPFVMTAILFAVGSRGAWAAPTGVYDILTFPSCTTWSVNSTAGVNQPGPSNYVETMTDGLGNVVFTRSQAGGIGTFFFWGSGSFTTQPKANPITEHIVMDGVTIANIVAVDPCAPIPIPTSSTPQLVAMAVLLSLFGILAIRRKWRQGRDMRR
jgi:hypothetical protein